MGRVCSVPSCCCCSSAQERQAIDVVKTVMMNVCGYTVQYADSNADAVVGAGTAARHPPTGTAVFLTWPPEVHGPSEGYDFQPFDRSSSITAELDFSSHLTGRQIRFRLHGALQNSYASDSLLTNTFALSSTTARLVPKKAVFDGRTSKIAIAWCTEEFYDYAMSGKMAMLCPNQSLFPPLPPHQLLLSVVERVKPHIRKYTRRGYDMLQDIKARRDPAYKEHIIYVNVSYHKRW